MSDRLTGRRASQAPRSPASRLARPTTAAPEPASRPDPFRPPSAPPAAEEGRGGRPRVVVIGAGFGGLWAIRALAGAEVEIVLIDRHNHHTFLPLLYQVAAAELEAEDIVYPVRSVLRAIPGATFLLAEATEIDLEARTVTAGGRPVPYDYLVVAAGSATHFFGVPGAAERAFPLKSLEEGIALRNRILSRFEKAVHEPSPARRRRALAFAVVGGGATGVEFAGALAELVHGPLARDYPALDIREVSIVILEAEGRLLPGFPPPLASYALARLRRLGVETRLGARVGRVDPRGIRLEGGAAIPTETVVWTAGVRGAPVAAGSPGLAAAPGGRIAVGPTLQVPGHPEVYAVGDIAAMGGGGLPLLAPVAMQQGVAAARNILRQIRGELPLPFRYRDAGAMVILGRNAAVARIGRLSFTGFPAWLLWVVVHIYKLIGFRNRLLVLIDWAWDYFLFDRAVRLILPSPRER